MHREKHPAAVELFRSTFDQIAAFIRLVKSNRIHTRFMQEVRSRAVAIRMSR